MSLFIKLLTLSLAVCLVSACQDKHSYSYLMEHPEVLKKQVEQCRNEQSPSEQCKTVLYAASNFSALLNAQQQNPELFGEHVMEVEAKYVATKKDYLAAQENFKQMRGKSANPTEIKLAEEKLSKAKKDYHDVRDEMKGLLAVIGVNSPE